MINLLKYIAGNASLCKKLFTFLMELSSEIVFVRSKRCGEETNRAALKMAKRSKDRSRINYSAEQVRIGPSCGKPVSECDIQKARHREPGDGIVRVRRETKGRRGKAVTTISGIPMDDRSLLKLASELKRLCGTGGTVRDGIILIQGDQSDLLVAELQKQGYTVKRAGG
jgi:translation initiation factor 1